MQNYRIKEVRSYLHTFYYIQKRFMWIWWNVRYELGYKTLSEAEEAMKQHATELIIKIHSYII